MTEELTDSPDDVTVVATGGLAPLVLDEARSIDVFEPWLTLIGLRLIYERNISVSS
jgi:type III pantothenate kinase